MPQLQYDFDYEDYNKSNRTAKKVRSTAKNSRSSLRTTPISTDTVIANRASIMATLDSDDELLNGSLSKLIEIIRNSGDDIIVCRIFKNKEELIPWSSLFSSGAQYSAKEMIDFGYLHGTACGCIIKRTFVEDNHIVFPVGVYNGEDGFFFHSCLYFSGYLRFENIRMYNVLGAEGSLSRTYNKERVQRMLSSLRTVEDTLNSYPLNYNRKFILDYIKYSILSGLITATVYTKGTGLVYLLKHNCNHIIKMELDDNVVFLRAKMVLLQRSFVLFYLLAWAKKFLKHFYC